MNRRVRLGPPEARVPPNPGKRDLPTGVPPGGPAGTPPSPQPPPPGRPLPARIDGVRVGRQLALEVSDLRGLAQPLLDPPRAIRRAAWRVHRTLVELAAVGRVREPVAAVRMRNDVVGRVEPLAVVRVR